MNKVKNYRRFLQRTSTYEYLNVDLNLIILTAVYSLSTHALYNKHFCSKTRQSTTVFFMIWLLFFSLVPFKIPFHLFIRPFEIILFLSPSFVIIQRYLGIYSFFCYIIFFFESVFQQQHGAYNSRIEQIKKEDETKRKRLKNS